ncbi:MAG: hypothetical protein R2879_13170 [Saprospiraceae bacterium]
MKAFNQISGNRILQMLLAAFSLAAIFPACTYEYIEDVNPVCFERDVLPVLVSNCTQSGCHNSIDREKGYDFSSYSAIMSNGAVKPGNYQGSELYKVLVAIGERAMPPSPNEKLSLDQIERISLWIEQGANPTSCDAVVCDTSNVTYNSSVKPILQTYCYGCHAGSGFLGGIDYTNYSGVKATVDNGKLWGSVNHASGYSAMPQNGAKLSACDLQIIKTWIDAGAVDN